MMSTLSRSLTVVTCGKNNLVDVQVTLESIKKFQNGFPQVLLVLSDFNDHEISELERSYSNLPLVIFQVPAEGVYKAMNYALEQIHEGHVLFLNSGDSIASESALNSLTTSCQPNRWGYGRAVISNDTSACQREYRFRPYVRLLHLLGLKYVPHPSSIVPISLIKNLGLFDLQYPIAADQKLLLQCSLISKPVVLNLSVSNFKLGGISTRTASEIVKDFRSISRDVLPESHFLNWPLLNPWWFVLGLRKAKELQPPREIG